MKKASTGKIYGKIFLNKKTKNQKEEAGSLYKR